MGNNISRTHLYLLTPRPSDQRIYEATLSVTNLNDTRSTVNLVVIDRETADIKTMAFRQSLTLSDVRDTLVWKMGCDSSSDLKLKINGVMADPRLRVGVLKDGTKILVSRIEREESIVEPSERSCKLWVARDSLERLEDEARMRALVAERWENKCRMTRNSFGWS